jgi:hypothetical protein
MNLQHASESPIPEPVMMQPRKKIIDAIRECFADPEFAGAACNVNNTVVFQSHMGTYGTASYNRTIDVIYDGALIALFEPNLRRLTLCKGADTIAIRRRLNWLLGEFAPEYRVDRRGHTVLVNQHEVCQVLQDSHSLTFDPWHNLRASRWDAPQPTCAAC